MIHITFTGDPRTKKNHQQVIRNRKTGKTMVIPSKDARTYAEACVAQIPPELRNANLPGPVNVQVEYYMRTRRRVDLVNLLQGTLDILAKEAHVLEDDNSQVIAGLDGSRVLYDKDNPRAEITITDFEVSAL